MPAFQQTCSVLVNVTGAGGEERKKFEISLYNRGENHGIYHHGEPCWPKTLLMKC